MYQLSNVLVLMLFGINSVLAGVVVSWGEVCEFTAECGDHRLVCEDVSINNTISKRCVCDRYHDWNGTLTGCVQKYKAFEILGMLQEKYNISERIEYEANIVFLAQIAAGLIVLTVGLICSCVVSIYCYHMWKEDTELDALVHRLEAQNKINKANTSRSAR